MICVWCWMLSSVEKIDKHKWRSCCSRARSNLSKRRMRNHGIFSMGFSSCRVHTLNKPLLASGAISPAYYFVHLYTPDPSLHGQQTKLTRISWVYILFIFLFPYCRCYKQEQQQENGQQRQSSMPLAHSSTAKQQHRQTRLQKEIKLVRNIQVRLVSSYYNEESTTKFNGSAMPC